MARFEGKVVFVTGAARGLGFAIAERFFREGARGVLAMDVDADAIESAAASWGVDAGRVIKHAGDVRSRESVGTAVGAAVAR